MNVNAKIKPLPDPPHLEEAPFMVFGFGRDGEETAEAEAWDIDEAYRIGEGMYDDWRTVSYEIWDCVNDREYQA